MIEIEIGQITSEINPRTRVAQPNPILGCNWLNTIGCKTPPRLLPEEGGPVAKAFLVLKCLGILATEAMKR